MKSTITLYLWITLSIFVFTDSSVVKSQTKSSICSGVYDLEWAPTDNNLLAAVNEEGLWLLTIEEDQSNHVLFPLENATSLDFSPDGNAIAVTSCSEIDTENDNCLGVISIFDLETESWLEIAQYDFRIDNVQFSPDGNLLAVVQDKIQEWGLRFINLTSMESTTIVDRTRTNVIIDYAIDSNLVAISNGVVSLMPEVHNGVTVWEIDTGSLVASTSEGQQYIGEVVFWDEPSTVAFVDSQAQTYLWQFRENTFTDIQVTDTYYEPFHNFKLIPDRHYLLASLAQNLSINDRKLYLWDLQNREEIFSANLPFRTLTDTWPDINSSKELLGIAGFDQECTVYIVAIKTGESFEICFTSKGHQS